MANYKTVVTQTGLRYLAGAPALGEKLHITQAKAGSGRPTGDPGELTALVKEEQAQVSLTSVQTWPQEGKTVGEFTAQVTNKGLAAPLPVREVGIFARLGEAEFLFVYIFLDGPDTDNIIPISQTPGQGDTKHLYSGKVVLTDQEAASVSVEILLGAGITFEEMAAYAAPKEHRHTAEEVQETTGETVEAAQRRQDEKSKELERQMAELSQTGGAAGQQLKSHIDNRFLHLQNAAGAQDGAFYGKKDGAFGFYKASATEITVLPLTAAGWAPEPNRAGVYRQQVTQGDIVAIMEAGRTALDSYADLDTEELLEYQGVEKLWIENRKGTPVALCKGAKPLVDIAVQVRVSN